MTTIYVTHDQVEAMTLGQRVAVMRKGELQQVARAAGALRPPDQPLRGRVHRQPVDELLPGRGRATDGGAASRSAIGEQRLDVDDAEVARRRSASGLSGDRW